MRVCVYVCVCVCAYTYIGPLVLRVECSPMARETGFKIPGQVMPKTQKMVLASSLFNTQLYNVLNLIKLDQSRERSCAFPSTSV